MDHELRHEPAQPAPKSVFVTVIAWIFIVLGGFATFIGILQNAMIWLLVPKAEFANMLQQANQVQPMPPVFTFLFEHLNLYFLVFLLLSITVLISAIGLLKRRNWARVAFIALMFIGILWNIVGLAIQFLVINSMPGMDARMVPPTPEFHTMMHVMQIMMVVFAVAISALYGFILMKLCTRKIRGEFV